MKRTINLLLSMMIPLVLSGCIISSTPSEGPISLIWGQNQTFTVTGLGGYQWYLDNAPLTGETNATYTFKSTAHVLGTYQLKVVSTSLGSGQRVWDVTVKSVPVSVPLATGCADLTNVGLLCDTTLNCNEDIPVGGVISQSPAVGTIVPAGSTVHLTLSSGTCANHEVEVPAATGCASINAAGLVCSTSTSCSNEVPAGMVLNQSPAAGTMIMQGATVSLTLSSGPCTIEVEVPNATSCADIEAAGFICSRIRDCSMTVPLDGLISQSPAPGLMAMPGSVVTLTLSSGMCQAQVPNATTCAEIEAAGLVCSVASICSNDHPVPGTFLSLSPPAGTGIAPGATVTLTQSNGPCTVEVPDAASCDDITATGWLLCNLTYECNDEIPAGTKLSQNPAPGSIVAPGTTVDLVFCSGKCPVMLPTPQNVSATDVDITSQTDPTLNHNLDDRVTITWDAVEGAEYYKIYRANSAIGTYTLIGTSTTTTYNDMQSAQEIPELVLPAFPDLPSGHQAENTATLDAYEATVRPIAQQFKDFKYYKVKAATSDPAYTESAFSAYDEGRMDYTAEEFYSITKGVGMGIPMARLFIAADPIGLGTNVYWYDTCGDGNMHITITLSGLNGVGTATIGNFVESLYYNTLIGMVDCSPTKRKLLITNGDISGTVDLSMTGSLTGSFAFTGNYAGKFNSIYIPVNAGSIDLGTMTLIYNGHTIPDHVLSL